MLDDRFDPAVRIAEYDPAWPVQAAEEVRRLERGLGPVAVRLAHVGSTAVPGLAAKPILDLQLSVASIELRAAYVAPLERAGHLFVPAPGSPGHEDLDCDRHRRRPARGRARRPDRPRGLRALGPGALRRRRAWLAPPRPREPGPGQRQARRAARRVRRGGPRGRRGGAEPLRLRPRRLRRPLRPHALRRRQPGPGLSGRAQRTRLAGRLLAEATNALLAAGALDLAVGRIAREAAAW